MNANHASRPNILLITADQVSAHHLGCYGDPTGATPNLDALAARGVQLAHAYTASPVCIPARASMYTGRYPHTHGKIAHIKMHLDPRPPLLGEVMSRGGYRTALIGKTHFHPADDPMGFQSARLTLDTVLDHELGLKDGYLAFLNERGILDQLGVQTIDRPTMRAMRDKLPSLPEELQRATWVANETCEAMKSMKSNADSPFFIYCSFVEPHGPEECPREYSSKFTGRFRPPMTRPGELSEKPSVQRMFMNEYWPMMKRSYPNVDENLMRQRFYGLLNLVDTHIGRILRTLEECGLRESTVVMFLADHGESLGDHEMWGKCFFYDSCARIPWIVAGPGIPRGGKSSALATNVDLLPTLLEFSGVSNEGLLLDGASLALQIRDPSTPGASAVYSELCQNQCLPEEMLCNCKMVRTQRWKYVYYSQGPEEELYDMEADPHELHNLADLVSCRTVIDEMRGRLLRWLVESEANRLHPTPDSHYPLPRYTLR